MVGKKSKLDGGGFQLFYYGADVKRNGVGAVPKEKIYK